MASRFGSVFLFGLVTAALLPAADNTPVDYGRDVRPILSENCFPCHGQDSKKRMAGLRLDSFEGAAADRGGHAAIVSGKPEASILYRRISSERPEQRMPPAYSNRRLTADQISILKRWIEEGGVYTKHWAFVPPQKAAVPSIADRTWAKQPIDAFVYKRLETEGLRPSRASGPETWLRRVSLDLTGLPPAPAELDAFSKDAKARGEAAYRATVDRLLASPRYGERMALEWLDVARYADTHGFNNDSARSMWRWRDWVIESFNSNMPYDRFITEQLAGDLLPNPTVEQRIATGFGRNHVINSEGGIIEEEYRVSYVADRVRTLGMAWLGLTIECARCHDHKFDPVTQRDYYRFFAFFNNVPETGEDGRVANAYPSIPAPNREQQAKMRELESAITELQIRLERREKSAPQALSVQARGIAPTGTVFQIQCESAYQELTPSDGVMGKACTVAAGPSRAQIAEKTIPVSKRKPVTFSFWLRPETASGDAPLFSTMDYATSPASTGYGKGLDLRLVAGELEFRFADRFPAYSLRVRSEGAGISVGQWRHLTLIYEGAASKDTGRAQASWVRIFADGRELPVRLLNDDLALPDEKDDRPSFPAFRIGWDTSSDGARYAGRFDEVAVWARALTPSEVAQLFESQAIPYALARKREQQASPIEASWLRAASLHQADPRYAQDQQKLDSVRAEWLALRRTFPAVMVMEEMTTPRQTKVLLHGMYNTPGEDVDSGVPEQLLGAWPTGAPKNRLGLAQWLTKPYHPLTARVVVNRLWQQLFGQGLVKSSDNFGMQGDSPSHPDLLDWLAREFVASGWNLKALTKRIVLSATYRQDSASSPELVARDPENRLLARGPRFRLPAEIIRDQALEISGLLKNRLGGPSVYPYQPEDLYKGIVVAANYPGTKYVEDKGDDLYRRSLYTFWKRTVPHPMMIAFDAPDREFCIVRRATTNTPLQALTLMNDPIFVEAARKLAERAIHEGGPSPDARLAFAFRLATGRSPDDQEKQILRNKLDEMLNAYRVDEAAARSLVTVGASPRDPTIPVSELAAYTAVANMILNLDEVITKG